jgi:hypothetical protein
MDASAEHKLVVRAVCEGLGNCFEWDERASRIVLNDPDMKGCLPRFIRQRVIELARSTGGACVEQVKELRENWRDNYAYYYKVILPISGYRHGIFVEIRYTGDEDDEDPEFPEALLVGAHPEKK